MSISEERTQKEQEGHGLKILHRNGGARLQGRAGGFDTGTAEREWKEGEHHHDDGTAEREWEEIMGYTPGKRRAGDNITGRMAKKGMARNGKN
jgi:hypothetical protein